MKISWFKHTLTFKRPSGTSRGVLHGKDSWFITAQKDGWAYPAIGECSIIEGLSPDDHGFIEAKLDEVCHNLQNKQSTEVKGFPAIEFALEMLEADIQAKGTKVFGKNSFTSGKDQIAINGLIWMGDPAFMLKQIEAKIDEGYQCLKLKIGALDFEEELRMISTIRKEFNLGELEIRVDANGGFSPANALERLNRLSEFYIHSIEQPIAQNQWSDTARLCMLTPIPIALDEELIGQKSRAEKEQIIQYIRPHYIILKPSLVGGLAHCDEWINIAETNNIGWWLTSALESNIGLNAIAQYAYKKSVTVPQGLGTGALFTNNVVSPLYIQRQFLKMNPNHFWDLKMLDL